MPDTVSLTLLASLLAACLMLVLGDLLVRKVSWLTAFSIPAPIVGGLIFALAALLLSRLADVRVAFDTSAKTSFLLLFFASIGLTADFALLRRGSTRLVRFLIVLFPFLIVQNLLGLFMAKLLGLHAVFGLIAGSITLVGGHGTGAAYAERFANDYDLLGVMGLTMTSATLGLVIGGIVGGPVTARLLRRLGPAATPPPVVEGNVIVGPATRPMTTISFIASLGAALACVVAGQAIGRAMQGAGVTVPEFLWCLVVGVLVRNIGAAIGWRLNDAATELIGSTCLSLFLVWTMMTLELAGIIALAGPLLVILAAQTVLVALWATFVVFRFGGRDYEAAVSAGAFSGFAMGATATAIANMQAVTRRHGPAPETAVVIPIVGAFFVDLMNLGVLTSLLLLPRFAVSG
jgi:ESS family glutamate:Na+ symporter